MHLNVNGHFVRILRHALLHRIAIWNRMIMKGLLGGKNKLMDADREGHKMKTGTRKAKHRERTDPQNSA